MADFIMCIVQYVVIGALLLAVGGVGAFIGIKMRKSSDAKKAAAAATEEQRLNSSVMIDIADSHACMNGSVISVMN